jgi:hypothetical protein
LCLKLADEEALAQAIDGSWLAHIVGVVVLAEFERLRERVASEAQPTDSKG